MSNAQEVTEESKCTHPDYDCGKMHTLKKKDWREM